MVPRWLTSFDAARDTVEDGRHGHLEGPGSLVGGDLDLEPLPAIQAYGDESGRELAPALSTVGQHPLLFGFTFALSELAARNLPGMIAEEFGHRLAESKMGVACGEVFFPLG